MKYNPKIHHRRSIRLKWYGYTQEGLYFVTICCQDRECLFGEIIDGEMKLYDAGNMVSKWYYKLEEKFPDIKCQEMIIMPNHFHCIIENIGSVGADPSVCQESGEHMGSPLHRIVQWFKTMTTNEYIRGVKNLGWQRFNGKLWQRNYYEHIVRNEESYQKISNYIIDNPLNWEGDKFWSS